METITVAWKVVSRPGGVTILPPTDLTPIDAAFRARLEEIDGEPVTGPKPLAIGPYRLSLSRLGRGNRYHEAVIRDVEPMTEILYRVTAAPAGLDPVVLGPFSLLVAAPQFTAKHMIGGRSGDLVDPAPAWIGHVRRDDGVTHVRIDLDDIPAEGPIRLRLRVGGRWYDVDPGAVHTNPRHRVPFVDWHADTVTLSAPDPEGSPVVVDAGGRMVTEAEGGGRGRTRLLIAHFCIQAINDLLEVPFSGGAAPDGYAPPRTYMQVTMRDEKGRYSSRPATRDVHPGGYLDGFTMHRRFGVKYHLAVNAGVLVLVAHDCPAELDTMQQDVKAGLMHPATAGYGSHRIPYYSAEANIRDVTACAEVIRTYLGQDLAPDVFYPDQRLYRQRAETVATLRSPHVGYVVLDSATGYYDNVASVVPRPDAAKTDLGPTMLWTDEVSRVSVLFIDTTLKDQSFAGDPGNPHEAYRFGKPSLAVRRRFLRMALDPRLRERNLLVYGDDFEKACNNGWFEPVPQMREKWCAFLEWVSAHRTWLHVVTADDLDPDVDSVGEIDIIESIDAALDPGGIRTTDLYGNAFHFDSWQQAWRATPAEWIGGTLGEITDIVENALRGWPAGARNQLYETAWLAFLMYQHENAWNMQALEHDDPNLKPIGDPEEFTVVEGLQVRNVLVWLKASLWAEWARDTDSERTWVDDGPVLDAIRALPDEVGADPAARDVVRDPRRWDADPLETVVLYNRQALVVVDRNGGRVTHAFVLRDGIPRTVSGTFKSHQYRDRGGVECDGPVVQNTVWTPNHRYIGTDVALLGQRPVLWPQHRPVRIGVSGHSEVERVFPDNFNAYDCVVDGASAGVTCTYASGEPTQSPLAAGRLREMLVEDGRARRAGTGGGTTWHEPTTFRKTFTLSGTTLGVAYSGVQVGHLVDNELCVDLFAGAHEGKLLERRVDPVQRTVTVAMPERGAAAVRAVAGCELTATSLLARVDEAPTPESAAEFLELHRVLTEAVQVRATAGDLRYEIDLDAP
ncbi:hypothetical protein [Pseudonocardia nigra]|uniref:hypothetical protein n=1 Tax=Pseudonocardia nigra TaxID=1921578 RepID=UPI001C605532|nr:hypothetical protein [Pseudonocardia nigra]